MIMLRLSFFYAFIFLINVSGFGNFEKAPRIISHKSLSAPMIVDKEAIVKYMIVNLGDGEAKNIQLKDIYNPKVFNFIQNVHKNGSVLINVPKLGIGKEMTYNVTMVPKINAVYSTGRAEVEYNGAEYNEEYQLLGRSSTLGTLYIMSEEEYLNSSSVHIQIREIISFLVIGGLSVVVPLYAWMQMNTNGKRLR